VNVVTDERVAVYRKAAELLRQDGWTQGAFFDETGKHCLVAAVRAANLEITSEWEFPLSAGLKYQLHKTLREQWGSRLSLTWWNDAPGRTADEVITLLEQTAEKLEADETIA
jgi:hypothetical protein